MFDKLGNRYYDPATKTDDNGYFELKFVRPGKHYIQLSTKLKTRDTPEGESMVVTLEAGKAFDGIELIVADKTNL